MTKKMLKESFTVRAILLLLALLLISLYIASGYLAKYTSNAGDNDGANVAAFSFNINNDTALNLDLSSVNAPGTSQTYTFTVVSPNTNEVARNCSISIKTTNNLPLTISLQENSTTLAQTTAAVGTGIAYELSANGQVAPNTALSKTYTVTVAWPAAQNSSSYAGVVGAVLLEVKGVQLD